MFCTDIVCLLVPGQPYEGGRNASFDLRESQGDVLGWADGPGQPQVAMTVRYRCEQLTQRSEKTPIFISFRVLCPFGHFSVTSFDTR